MALADFSAQLQAIFEGPAAEQHAVGDITVHVYQDVPESGFTTYVTDGFRDKKDPPIELVLSLESDDRSWLNLIDTVAKSTQGHALIPGVLIDHQQALGADSSLSAALIYYQHLFEEELEDFVHDGEEASFLQLFPLYEAERLAIKECAVGWFLEAEPDHWDITRPCVAHLAPKKQNATGNGSKSNANKNKKKRRK